MENKARQNEENGARKGSILFQDFQNLQRIWTAPLVLRYNSDRYEIEMQKKRDLASEDEEEEGSLKDFIDDSEDTAESTAESSSNSDVESVSDGSVHSKVKKKKKKKKNAVTLPRRTRAMAAECESKISIKF
jgi:transcriptional regulator ATRX